MPRFWLLVGLALLVLVACGSSQSDTTTQSADSSKQAAEQADDAAAEIESLRQDIRLLEAQVAVLVQFVTEMESELSRFNDLLRE